MPTGCKRRWTLAPGELSKGGIVGYEYRTRMTAAIPKQVWEEFKSAFERALDGATNAELLRAWQMLPQKTEFYERVLMPAVAQQLGRRFQIERLRCDYMFLDASGVPLMPLNQKITIRAHDRRWNPLVSCIAPAA